MSRFTFRARCTKATALFKDYMTESNTHSSAVATLALASLALGDRVRAREALELNARGPNSRTLMLQFAQLLKIEGHPAWRSRAVEARAMAKLELGIHDPLASYQGQFLALEKDVSPARVVEIIQTAGTKK